MDFSKQRKSWFCASPTTVTITPSQSSDGFARPRTDSEAHKLRVAISSDENQIPTTVTASDILTLTTFSRRAVVDFGLVTVSGRPVKRYLLVENPHDEDQTIAIQRGLPSPEFCLDWIGSRSARLDKFACVTPGLGYAPIYDDPHVTMVQANQGRALLQITWTPLTGGNTAMSPTGFHHIVQFRVNDSYPLQTMVIGRFAVPPPERGGKFKVPKRALFASIPSAPSTQLTASGLPSWTRTPMNEISGATRSRFVDKLPGSTHLRTIRSMSSKPSATPNSTPATGFQPRSISHDRALRSGYSASGNYSNSDQREPWQSEADLRPNLLSSQVLEEQLAALERKRAQLNSALGFQCLRPNGNPTRPVTSPGPPSPQSHYPSRYPSSAPQSPGYLPPLCASQPLTHETVLRRSSSVMSHARLNTAPPLPDVNSTLLNATAIGFLSPKLVRSPVLKGGPLTFGSEYSIRPSDPPKAREGNLFHPDFAHTLSEVSETGLTQWLNSVFAPCVAVNQAQSLMDTHACTPGTSAYYATMDKAARLLHSTVVTAPGQRVEREVDEGKIVPAADLSFSVDKGAQRRLLDQLTTTYAPIWLHLAVDVLNTTNPPPVSGHQNKDAFGANIMPIPDQPAAPAIPISKKLTLYLFSVTSRSRPPLSGREQVHQSKKAPPLSVLQPKAASKASRDLVHNRHAIKRFLIFVWFLDRLKHNRVIKYDPCLFRPKSRIKSSADHLLQFARNFLSGENNLVRRMATLGARVTVVQTPLDEYQFHVTNLAVDLRDGIRLVKLAELLLPSLPKTTNTIASTGTEVNPADLMSLVRYPAISRLQKIHNVGLALKAFEQSGSLCMPDGGRIDPRDIVDGHREKCLTLLWCLLLRYQVVALVDVALLDEEVSRLRSQLSEHDPCEIQHNLSNELKHYEGDVAVHAKLLQWAATVGRLYGLRVDNLDESFADGRALCFLVHHYLPTVMPKGLIRRLTTSSVGSTHDGNVLPVNQLIRNNRYNLRLFQSKLSFLGDMPVLLTSSTLGEMPHMLPPGLVLATLAYLASRLVLVSRDKQLLAEFVRDHAARILQAAWRRLRSRRELKGIHLVSPGARIVGSLPQFSEIARKSLFGTPSSPAMQQFFNSRRSRAANGLQSPLATPSSNNQIQSVIRIQAAWRGYCVRRDLRIYHKQHKAAVSIQAAWRALAERRRWKSQQKAIVVIQTYCRGFLARQRLVTRLREIAQQRESAAIRIQASWRGYRVRRDLRMERRQQQAAVLIQSVARGWIARRRFILQRKAILLIQRSWRETLRLRFRSALLIQRWWRERCLIPRELARKRRAASRLQAAWRGYQTRKRLTQLAASTRPSSRKPPVRGHKPTGPGTAHVVLKSGLVAPAVAQRLIEVRTRLEQASRAFQPERCLASRAQTAMTCILYSNSLARVFDAIKILELCTRLSTEVCYSVAGLQQSRSHGSSAHLQHGCLTSNRNNNNNNLSLRAIFLHLIRGCNRSVPHQDMLVSVTGTLLNLARHRPLAECTKFWWTAPCADGLGDPKQSWLSPALLDQPRSRLNRAESLTRLSHAGDNSVRAGLSIDERQTRRRESSANRLTESFSASDPSQSSLVEALIGLLLQTCRPHPGTPAVRLFSRICCLLSILCEAAPAHLLHANSMLPLIEKLSDCLARPASSSGWQHLNLNRTLERLASSQPHSTVVRQLTETAELRESVHLHLRQLLSCELDWHLYPIKSRPDPLVALDFLLLTLWTRVHNQP